MGDYAGMQDPGPAYLEAARNGDLTAYVVGALWWERDLGEEQVASLVERRERYSHGRFRATSVKIMQDGVAENFTAAMTTPYLDASGTPTDQLGALLRQPGCAPALRGRTLCRGLPGPRARDRRPRGP